MIPNCSGAPSRSAFDPAMPADDAVDMVRVDRDTHRRLGMLIMIAIRTLE